MTDPYDYADDPSYEVGGTDETGATWYRPKRPHNPVDISGSGWSNGMLMSGAAYNSYQFNSDLNTARAAVGVETD